MRHSALQSATQTRLYKEAEGKLGKLNKQGDKPHKASFRPLFYELRSWFSKAWLDRGGVLPQPARSFASKHGVLAAGLLKTLSMMVMVVIMMMRMQACMCIYVYIYITYVQQHMSIHGCSCANTSRLVCSHVCTDR